MKEFFFALSLLMSILKSPVMITFLFLFLANSSHTAVKIVMKSSKFPRGDLYTVTIIHDGISIAHSSQSTSFDNLLMSCLVTMETISNYRNKFDCCKDK
jgi:hypothetical protein